MESKALIGTALNDHIRVYLADTKKICEDARITHNLYPTSLAALGRVLSITAIMGLMNKGEDETVSVTINGGGPIGTILTVANNKGEVKGFCGDSSIYLKYNETNKLAVGLAVGTDGYLKVIKNLKLKENYTSQVKLQSGEIGEDFAYYFALSEQRPSIVSVGVLVDTDYSCKSAGVLLIELLPNHNEEDIIYLEKLSRELKPISNVLAQNNNLHAYLHSLFDDIKILEEKELKYHCDCSRERFLKGLLTLPEEDIDLDEIEVKCEFCNKEYHFTKDELLSYVQDR